MEDYVVVTFVIDNKGFQVLEPCDWHMKFLLFTARRYGRLRSGNSPRRQLWDVGVQNLPSMLKLPSLTVLAGSDSITYVAAT
jgi:hypothetical protein